MTSVFRISHDIHQTQSQVSIPATQGADNVRLIIRLTEKGNPFDIEDGSYAIFSAVKPDGNPLYNDCAIYRNSTIVYDFTPQTTAVEGITMCQIHLYDTYGRKLHSPRFQIVVHPDIYGNEIESTEEYKALAKFVSIKGDIEQDISNNASAIAALNEKVTTAGTVTIHTTQWSYTTPHTAYMGFPSNTVQKGQAVLFMPLSDATKEAAAKARLSVGVDEVTDGGGDFTDYVLFVQAEEGAVPTVDLDLGYIVLRTTGDLDAMVALIGIDSYGEGEEPTSVDLSGFAPDEDGKGRIVETYADSTVVTELTYDDTGRIIKIGDTTLEWGEEE